jgi:excisionase family DNA binding protein
MTIEQELTIEQAAEIVNVSPSYLRKLLDLGEIPFRQTENKLMILEQDLKSYYNQITTKRQEALAELAQQAQELKMGY